MASIIYPNSYAEAWLEPTHVSRVAPDRDLWKDARPTELRHRGKSTQINSPVRHIELTWE